MPSQRVFLGWDKPVLDLVTEHILARHTGSRQADLQDTLIVVPTRQSARRLRQALARRCTEVGASLFPPRIVEPVFFLHERGGRVQVANPSEVAAIWAQLLMAADLHTYRHLFPSRVPAQDFSWALYMGGILQGLRDTLADSGLMVKDVVEQHAQVLEEADRWQDLAALESAYLERLAALSRVDPCQDMIENAPSPVLPDGISNVILAGIPDPTRLMVSALERLSLDPELEITVLVHAGESAANAFDEWGRPLPDVWAERTVEIPDPDANIILAGPPLAQASRVLAIMAGEQERFGPGDVAVGVPDSSLAPMITSVLEGQGLATFDPEGTPLDKHPIFRLIDAYHRLVIEESYGAFSAFLRNADVLDYLRARYMLSPLAVLQQLDEFQNLYLPHGLQEILDRLRQDDDADFAALARAADYVNEQVESFAKSNLEACLRSLLQGVYSIRDLRLDRPDDQAFAEVAEAFADTLTEVAAARELSGIEKSEAFMLLVRRLSGQRFYQERRGPAIDLEGWLELHWNDAPLLIVTGMGEGCVPGSHPADVFLPDSLKRAIGIKNEEDLLARDVYLMSAMIESRRKEGRTCFIAGKTSARGDPVRPSRLLFHCPDSELPERAMRLFGDAEKEETGCPSTISFKLDPGPPADVGAQIEMSKLSVTGIRDYLACPFRFYLKHILGMETLSDDKMEMDALDFGTVVHESLQLLAATEEMRRCADPEKIAAFLSEQTENWATGRFGPARPLQISIQLGAAKQRLWAAAQAQARLVEEGWVIIETELSVRGQIGGIHISGRIDRVDRHEETGVIRLLDYKTSDRAQPPHDTHTGPTSPEDSDYARMVNHQGKVRRWTDLQLPLYAILYREQTGFKEDLELGYFNLPKGPTDTGVLLWEGLSGDIIGMAKRCAEGVVQDIRDRRFWPPRSRVRYDDFESLFHGDAAECIDTESFIRALGLESEDTKQET